MRIVAPIPLFFFEGFQLFLFCFGGGRGCPNLLPKGVQILMSFSNILMKTILVQKKIYSFFRKISLIKMITKEYFFVFENIQSLLKKMKAISNLLVINLYFTLYEHQTKWSFTFWLTKGSGKKKHWICDQDHTSPDAAPLFWELWSP